VGNQEGNRAPGFELESLDGEMVALSDFRGKIVMVNFWATWCEPCKDEMPHIQTVFENWSDEELAILAIDIEESTETVQSFLDSEGKEYNFPVLLDSEGGAADDYNVSEIPRTFFIDAEGIIQKIQVRPFSSEGEIEAILDSL
ncbi:unnamed protein product, partial [marine sediment metagenome]